mmetsp:Transcript_27520/g.41121  ORF Transcript_27520/g.41121 Transcript_27520/m.41121 type:complete len:119 (-) Transcript_27520:534-890(-)
MNEYLLRPCIFRFVSSLLAPSAVRGSAAKHQTAKTHRHHPAKKIDQPKVRVERPPGGMEVVREVLRDVGRAPAPAGRSCTSPPKTCGARLSKEMDPRRSRGPRPAPAGGSPSPMEAPS